MKIERMEADGSRAWRCAASDGDPNGLSGDDPTLQPADEQSLLDSEHLAEIRELAAVRPRLPQQLIALFAECMQEYLATCEQARDCSTLALVTHRIAGSAASLGAPRLRALAEELENAVRRQTLTSLAPQSLNALRTTMDDTIGAYHQWLADSL